MQLSQSKMLGAVVGIAAFLYLPTLFHSFIALDDSKHIWQNPYIQKLSWLHLSFFWKTAYYGLYIPVVYNIWSILTALTLQLGLSDPITTYSAHLFHLLNLVLHAINSGLVFLCLQHLLRRRQDAEDSTQTINPSVLALIAALIFALHPLQVESVAWASGLKDVSMGFFGLSAWILYLLAAPGAFQLKTSGQKKSKRKLAESGIEIDPLTQWQPHRRQVCWRYLFLASLCFAASVMSKPASVTLPLAMALTDIWMAKRTSRSAMIFLSSWLVFALYIIWMTKGQQPNSRMEFELSAFAQVQVAIASLGFYFYKLLLPFQMAPDYGLSPPIFLKSKEMIMSLIASIPIIGSLFLFWTPYRIYAFCGAIFIIGLAPVLGLIPFEYQNMSQVADRYVYFLPMMAFGIAVVETWQKAAWNRGLLIPGAFLMALALISLVQIRVWRNNQTLFTHTLQVNPKSYLSFSNLGLTAVREDRMEDAVELLKKSLEVKPDYTAAQSNLAAAYFKKRDFLGVVNYLNGIFSKQPNLGRGSPAVYADMFFNYGAALLNLRELDAGRDALIKSIEINPDHYLSHYHLGRVYLQYPDQRAKALEHLQNAVRLNPNSQDARRELEALRLAN